MKKFFMRVVFLGVLAGVGYLVCNKFCNKDKCCKKQA